MGSLRNQWPKTLWFRRGAGSMCPGREKGVLDPGVEKGEGCTRGSLGFLLFSCHLNSESLQVLKQATCLAYTARLQGR